MRISDWSSDVCSSDLNATADAHTLFALMLAGLLGFFVLEKIALLRHSHHHEGDGHHHHKGHDRHEAGRGGVLILVGSSLHNLCDVVLVAAAFMAAPVLGLLTGADRKRVGWGERGSGR